MSSSTESAEIARLQRIIARAANKLRVMVQLGQIPARHEFDCLFEESETITPTCQSCAEGVPKRIGIHDGKYGVYACPLEPLCPHGMPLADNVCGPCSKGQPNRVVMAGQSERK